MRVAAYARVSTTRQAQAQGIEQQLDRLRAAAAERGWELDDQHVYRDDGYSGARIGRPGLDRLRDHAALAELDMVAGDRAGPAGPQLRPSGAADRRAGRPRLPGGVPGPADERRPARPAAAADPRGGRGVRADADRRADAPRAAGEAAGGHAAAVDHGAVRVPAGSRAAAPGVCGAGGPRGGGAGGASCSTGTSNRRRPSTGSPGG